MMQPILSSLRHAALLLTLPLLILSLACTSAPNRDVETTTIDQNDLDGDGVTSDEDCDDDDDDVGGPRTFFADNDGDGLGDSATSMEACVSPANFVENSGDTDPECATNNTDDCGVCDGGNADKDCFGVCFGDAALDACGACGGPGTSTYYTDLDGDGLGDPNLPVELCDPQEGFVENDNDPEPACATNNTDACNTCGGPGPRIYYPDSDGDGAGDLRSPVELCAPQAGFVANGDDAEPECATNDTDDCGVCAGGDADKDCFGVCFGGAEIDACDICGGPGLLTFYADLDGDNLGDPDMAARACTRPANHVVNSEDLEPNCITNDNDVCGVCAGPGPPTWYADADGDGLGDPNDSQEACARPDAYVAEGDDPLPQCASNVVDDCGVCDGLNADKDCFGTCFGDAAIDGCDRCAGGESGLEPAVEDLNDNGVPDLCDDECRTESRVIIQWTGIPAFGNAAYAYTFQVVLVDNGDMIFQYGDVTPFEASATIGIQSAGGAQVIEFAHNNNFPVEQPSIHMTHQDDGTYIADYFQPLYWLDIREAGEQATLPGSMDDQFITVDLGFEFPFFGETINTIQVGDNGMIGVSEPYGNYMNSPLPNSGLGGMIAPLWDDLDPRNAGQIHVFHQAPSCQRDCNGVLGGLARESQCTDCATGPEFGDVEDCNGDCGGTAQIDECGNCSGGATGVDK